VTLSGVAAAADRWLSSSCAGGTGRLGVGLVICRLTVLTRVVRAAVNALETNYVELNTALLYHDINQSLALHTYYADVML